jgi:dihydrofolate reductase
MSEQVIFAIYAISENGVIGKEKGLPWHLPEDSRFFRRMTLGKPVIMGRVSFESLEAPLKGRRNLVITRQAGYAAEGAETVASLEEALARCADAPEVAIIGGAQVYREAIEKGYVSLIYETLVHGEVDGDTFFALAHPEDWEITEVDARQADERHAFSYTFRTLRRKNPPPPEANPA